MKKALSQALIALGSAFLVVALALPMYVVPKGKVVPKDFDYYSVSKESEGYVLDAAALAAKTPIEAQRTAPECLTDAPALSCFIWTDVMLQNQRHIIAQEPTTDKEVTLEGRSALVRTDLAEPKNLISSTVDRITLTRKTAFPVDRPVSSFNVTNPIVGEDSSKDLGATATPEFTRDGLQYQFPLGTEKKAYPFFDGQVLRSQDLDFVDKETLSGETIYRFSQVVAPTALFPLVEARLSADGDLSAADQASLADLRLTLPASAWGLTPTDVPGWDASDPRGPDIDMSRYYTVNRTLHVQPDTGVIVNAEEETWMYYAKDDTEAATLATPENRERELANPRRTALYFPSEYSEATVDSHLTQAKDKVHEMKLIGVYLPWGGTLLGIILLILGIVSHRRLRRAA